MKKKSIVLIAVLPLLLTACNKSDVTIPEMELPWPPDESSSPYSNRVLEYFPAPGQFINSAMMGFTGEERSGAEVIAYADRRLHPEDTKNRGTVSLGGFGGYIVVGFDHSIQSLGGYDGYDFSITGNQFEGSSEPGIVWVMPDKNGDGLPNDGEWYELKGAYHDEAVRNYSVTYYRPGEDGILRWTDSNGVEGVLPRHPSHENDFYPVWIENDSYTLTGSLIPDLSGFLENGNYTTGDYGWGYADNWGDDMVGGKQKNYFRISDAVDNEGEAVELEYIDFIKVQTGVNVHGVDGDDDRNVGELSTEVLRFKDENM